MNIKGQNWYNANYMCSGEETIIGYKKGKYRCHKKEL